MEIVYKPMFYNYYWPKETSKECSGEDLIVFIVQKAQFEEETTAG